MNTQLHPLRFGFATGTAGAIFYLGCVLVMLFAGRQEMVFFFNSLFHGLDVEPLLKLDVGFGVALFGLVNTFGIGWLFGATVASLYNLFASGNRNADNR
ncbi:MAG: DUF5676 family membrane protein [Opitutales bacterium]